MGRDPREQSQNDPSWPPLLGRGVRFVHDRVRNTDLLLMPEQVIVLNDSGAAILRRCTGAEALQEIVSALSVEFEGEAIATDVSHFLAMALREGWVV
jgi:pyrroloquinoline quinone biosynthesis protein D